MSKMTVVTWNVNSVRARMPRVIPWLRTHKPDVVLLQETKCRDEDFPMEAFEDEGYNVAHFGQKTRNGVAILSKTPLEDIQKGIPGFEDDNARYLEAVTQGIRVASIYVPNGQDLETPAFHYKLTFLKALLKHAQDLLTYHEVAVLGGDYNVAPYAEDLYDPGKSGSQRLLYSPQEQAALRAFFNIGYGDGLRMVHPTHTDTGSELFTWWDYRGGSFERNKGLRIDHLLLSPLAQDHLTDAFVATKEREGQKPSDHAPVGIVFKGSLPPS